MESVSKSGLQKVRTSSTTVQPESISRKDMRIRYLLTDLLKISRQIGTKYKVKLFGLYFYPFVVVVVVY